MGKLFFLATALTAMATACSALPGGERPDDQSDGWTATLNDGSDAHAYWCARPSGCMDGAGADCPNAIAIHAVDDIDKDRSPDAVQGGFFRKAAGRGHTLVVTCEG